MHSILQVWCILSVQSITPVLPVGHSEGAPDGSWPSRFPMVPPKQKNRESVYHTQNPLPCHVSSVPQVELPLPLEPSPGAGSGVWLPILNICLPKVHIILQVWCILSVQSITPVLPWGHSEGAPDRSWPSRFPMISPPKKCSEKQQ